MIARLWRWGEKRQLGCCPRSTARRIDNHLYIWVICHLECPGLQNQPSNQGMDQVLVVRLYSLDLLTRPPLAKGWTRLLQVVDECGQPGVSDRALAPGAKKSQETHCFSFPLQRPGTVSWIGKEKPEEIAFTGSHHAEINQHHVNAFLLKEASRFTKLP